MASIFRIKRRPAGGAAGAPTSLAAAELAYNEQDDKLYYGKGNNGSGVATSIIPIAGPGTVSNDLPLTGGTLTGNLTIEKIVPIINLNKTAAGQICSIYGRTGSFNSRWAIHLGNTAAESGGNAGSDFSLERFNDGGVSQGIALTVNRATGNMALGATPATGSNDTSVATTAHVHAAIKSDMDALSTFRATLSANQDNIVPSAFIKVLFNTAGINIGGHFSTINSRWTPPAGRVMLGATLYGGPGASSNIYAAIYKNSGVLFYVNSNTGPNTIGYASVQMIDVANGTDYYECYTLHNGAGNMSIYYGAGQQTAFWGARF